jgi:hypothetical protein
MKALIFENKVAQVAEESFPVHASMIWVDCPDNALAGWLYNPENGEIYPEPIPEPTQEEILEEYRSSIQSYIDSTAREKDYDNGFACATYCASSNQEWKAEAEAFVSWRDECWQYAYDVQTQVEGGQKDAPSLEDFINNAPVIDW